MSVHMPTSDGHLMRVEHDSVTLRSGSNPNTTKLCHALGTRSFSSTAVSEMKRLYPYFSNGSTSTHVKRELRICLLKILKNTSPRWAGSDCRPRKVALAT